jgi:hypothetical protein
MGLFIRQEEQRTDLQQRVAAELQEKMRAKAAQAEQPDGVKDSQYIKGTKQTTSLMWVWAVIALIVVGTVIFLIIRSM